MEWRVIVSYPETFNHQEAMLLDGVDPRIFAVLLGETKPETTEEKRLFVNCTKSLPSSDLEKALSKFYIQSRNRKNVSPTEEPKRIDYDRLLVRAMGIRKRDFVSKRKIDMEIRIANSPTSRWYQFRYALRASLHDTAHRYRKNE